MDKRKRQTEWQKKKEAAALAKQGRSEIVDMSENQLRDFLVQKINKLQAETRVKKADLDELNAVGYKFKASTIMNICNIEEVHANLYKIPSQTTASSQVY